MLALDGGYGEGGGQLVRTACALSAITGTPFRLHDIRARRDPPGLAPQHLTAVRAVAELCSGNVEGLAPRAHEIVFHPGALHPGDYCFDVGTAGSISLVLQACLPAAFAANGPVTLRVTGGTDVRAAPPLDYLRFVFLPLLRRMGLHAEMKVRHRGYYPRGGGHVEVEVVPGTPQPLVLESAGALQAIEGAVHVANLPLHVVERMQHTAERRLRDYPNVRITPDVLGRDRAFGPGGAIVLWARAANTLLGAGEVAQRGVPAERIAETAVDVLCAEIEAGATLDLHALDQLLSYAALAKGTSVFLARAWTSHAQTTAWLIEQFLPAHIQASAQGALTRVEIRSR